jgi:peptidoglycan-N-acetylglucosamine deacetylase
VYLWQPLWAFAVLERAAPNVLWRVASPLPQIALSFDDGPSPEFTPRVLEILKQHQARATFFLIGSKAQAHPRLVGDIRAGGHEIANHYFVNGTVLLADEKDFLEYVRRTEHVLAPLEPPKLFRPPGGVIWPVQVRMLREMGYTCVLGSAYPYDPSGPPAAYIRWLVVKNMRPGSIIILHDGIQDASGTIDALDGILRAAASKGLAVVPVGGLLRSAHGRTGV